MVNDPSQMLSQFRELAHQAHHSPGNAEVHQDLLNIQTVEHIQLLIAAITRFGAAQDYHAESVLLATNALTHIFSKFWTSTSPSDRLACRDLALTFLAQKGLAVEQFVAGAQIKLVCLITKAGWLEDNKYRDIVERVETAFIQGSPELCDLGQKIFKELVTRMNVPIRGFNLTQHRRTAVSFRDSALHRLFQISFVSLKKLFEPTYGTDEVKFRVMGSSLILMVASLNYDFVGTNLDESTEEAGTVQVPTPWRAEVQDLTNVELLFRLYGFAAHDRPLLSRLILEALANLAGVRRSLFSSDAHRSRFLEALMTGINHILSDMGGLNHSDNHNEFCKLLGRLKSNYQLGELVRSTGYTQWLELTTNFTICSFSIEWAANSVHHLLALWSRLVSAVPYMKVDPDGSASQLGTCGCEVVEKYVMSRLDGVDRVLSAAMDEPLDAEGTLMDQLDKLPSICRFQYSQIGPLLCQLFDPIFSDYRNLSVSYDPSAQGQRLVLEHKLAWLSYIFAAIVGGHTWHVNYSSSSKNQEADEQIDALLCKRVISLVSLVVGRSSSSPLGSERLEMAFLYFFQTFRRSYVGEHHGIPTVAELKTQSVKHHMFLRFFNALGLGHHMSVVSFMIDKLLFNLRNWAISEEVTRKTLALFLDIVSGYSSNKHLLNLDSIKILLESHGADIYPFLGCSENSKFRTTFHSILARLLFSAPEDLDTRFTLCTAPVVQVLAELAQGNAVSMRGHHDVKHALEGVFRDLRGIAQATHNRRAYTSLFDLLYPIHFPVLVQAADVWFDEPQVMHPLLHFMAEFVYNKAQRIMFEQSSADGILLFRETASLLYMYGRRVLSAAMPVRDVYKERYKGISLSLTVINRALTGGYVNFGVFALYRDPCLENVLTTTLDLVLSIPQQDVTAFPKLTLSYFHFLEVLFRNHIAVLFRRPVPQLTVIMSAVNEGVNALDPTVSTISSACIDHLASYYFKNRSKCHLREAESMTLFQGYLDSTQDLWYHLLKNLFGLVLFGNSANQWSLSRPILSLAFASDEAFSLYKQYLSNEQPPDSRARLEAAFTSLMEDIPGNLESSNRDKFTARLTAFRTTVRAFLKA